MRKIKILAIAPYEGMAEVLESIVKTRDDFTLTVGIGNLQSGLDIAVKRLETTEFDVIISRGGTAELLRSHLTLPVFEIPFTVYDLLCSLKMLDNYKGKFAITGFHGITENARILCDVLQKDVHIITFTDSSEVLPALRLLKEDAYSLIICDLISYDTAHSIGLNALFVASSADSINTAINDAIQFVNSAENVYCHRDLLKQTLMNITESAVIFDANKNIVFSSLTKEPESTRIISELQKHPDLYLFLQERSIPLSMGDSLYTITQKQLFYNEQPFSLLIISKSPQLFEPEDKIISLYSDFSETSPDTIFDNTANLVGTTSSLLEKYAATAMPVLITGETGTGKEKAAALLYRYGPYHNKPFYVIDCKLMTAKKWKVLLTSPNSPFNEVRSAIHIKNIERLSNSQLEDFYDYIIGSKLLKRNRVTFSLIDSDNKAADILNHLSNRLSCLLFPLTPLRERKDDISSIAALYINQMNISLGKQIIGFDSDALQMITDYYWPQNLDQFHRILKELILITDTAYISAENVRQILAQEKTTTAAAAKIPAFDTGKTLDEMTFDIITQVLSEEKGNKEKAARRLGISRTTLWRILKNNS